MKESTFGGRLRELRKKRGQTQKQVAEYLQVTTQAYSQYERDQRRPDYEQLIKLAEHYQVSLEYLMSGTQRGWSTAEPEGSDTLPPEAQEELRSYVAYLHHKYPKKKT